MKLYLAGPMTGLPEHNYPLFKAVTAAMREEGYEVVSPVECIDNEDQSTPYEVCLRRDLQGMLDCTAIALLPGWERSRGACLEAVIGWVLGYYIFGVALDRHDDHYLGIESSVSVRRIAWAFFRRHLATELGDRVTYEDNVA